MLARRDLAEAEAAGYRVSNRRAFFDKKRLDRAAVDGPTVRAVVAEHPDWSPERVALTVAGWFGRVPAYRAEGTGLGVPPPADMRAQVAAARRAARAERTQRETG